MSQDGVADQPQDAGKDAVSAPAELTPPSAGARRMRRHRERRRKDLRCLTIELRETEIDTLIRRGTLSADDRASSTAARTALYGFLDDSLR